MARKKVVKKRKARKPVRKVKIKRSNIKKSVRKAVSTPKKVVASKRKFDLVLKNLVLFAILFVVSIGLYNVFTDEILVSFFWILALITGFIAVAFLISYLILFFMKGFRK